MDGRIWSYPKKNGYGRRIGHWMKLYKHNGYLYANLCKNAKYKNHLMHRLMAETFLVKEKKDKEVNHLNGIKHDNRIENLEWCSSSENSQHAYDTGLHVHIGLKGEKNPNSKLTKKQVVDIRNSKLKPVNLAKKYKVGKNTISDILNKKTWIQI